MCLCTKKADFFDHTGLIYAHLKIINGEYFSTSLHDGQHRLGHAFYNDITEYVHIILYMPTSLH